MNQRRSLKVSYLGNRRTIAYKMGSTYDEILKEIMLQFQLPQQHKSLLQLSTDAGKVFSRRQLKNYLLLFPTSRIIFNLRYDNKDCANSDTNSNNTSAIANSKSGKRQLDSVDDDHDSAYPTTPVFRMNCFTGVYPGKCAAPPTKRVRFSEALNCIKVIPARLPQTSQVAGALRRTNSFIGEYPERTTNRQRLTARPILVDSFNHSNSDYKKDAARSRPWLHSFLNTYPTPKQLVFKQKVRRMLFTDTQKSAAAAAAAAVETKSMRIPRLQ